MKLVAPRVELVVVERQLAALPIMSEQLKESLDYFVELHESIRELHTDARTSLGPARRWIEIISDASERAKHIIFEEDDGVLPTLLRRYTP